MRKCLAVGIVREAGVQQFLGIIQIGASGLKVLYRMYRQSRGEAQLPERQTRNPLPGLTYNPGGVPAVNVVTIAIVGL